MVREAAREPLAAVTTKWVTVEQLFTSHRATGDEGRVLLQRRRDNDLWALPGGGMEMTDSLFSALKPPAGVVSAVYGLFDGDFLLTGTPVSQIQMSVAGPISGFVVVFVPLQR